MALGRFLHLFRLSFHICKMEPFPMPASMAIKKIWCDKLLLLLLLLLSRFSDVRLCATPWTAAHQAPSSMGFSRQGYWSGVPLLSPAVCYSHPNELRYPWMIPRNTHHHIGLPIPCTLELLPQGNNLKPLYISILFLGCLGLYPTIHLSTYEITYGQDYSFQHCLTL